ncbi:hypothetical protein QMZ05_39305 [Bradyrhizobium sp. INPA03-11B]|uniref:hypothetical protein n=1 Tax=Bradyrhizobium sp. INPA03-11B TaxID=418598 RepID=UPI00338D493B
MRTVSREELYQQVWSQPMTKVAAEYGVTGTALKKTCIRHRIPTPDRGYWAKLQHGKPVRKVSLPKLADTKLDRIRISGTAAERLPEQVRKAGTEARERLEQLVTPESVATASTESSLAEPSILGATRRAASRARPDNQGFVIVQGRGIVPLKIAPSSRDRTLQVLSRLFALAGTEGYRPAISDDGLNLVAENVSIKFGVEEPPKKTPHEPTASELKRRDDNLRWGLSRPPWPKYGYSPSGRLAIVIHVNTWSGLRRTYSDGKSRPIEAMLPEVVAGLAEHAALLTERRRADEERERQRRYAESRRQREEAFGAREKRRMEFVDAIHEQLILRSKLSAVLAHLESVTGDETNRAEHISAWLRRRIQQIDALVSPDFLDLSARSAKLEFRETASGVNAEDTHEAFRYHPAAGLQFWSIDEGKELATSMSALEWASLAGLMPGAESDDTTPGE